MSRLIAGRQSCAAIGEEGMCAVADACVRHIADAGRAGHCEGVRATRSKSCLEEIEAAAALQRLLARVQNVHEHWQLVEVQRLCAAAEWAWSRLGRGARGVECRTFVSARSAPPAAHREAMTRRWARRAERMVRMASAGSVSAVSA